MVEKTVKNDETIQKMIKKYKIIKNKTSKKREK